MLKPFREPQKQQAKTNQFGCGRPTGAADLKHANQWWGAKAKQLKPENCRPGNKQFGGELFSVKSFLSSFYIGEMISTGAYIRRATIYINDASSFSARVGGFLQKEADWGISRRRRAILLPINQTLDQPGFTWPLLR